MTESNHYAESVMMIRRPVKEVFDAFVNPEITTKFWFTNSSGVLQEGKTVDWKWKMYNLSIPVEVIKLDPNALIIIEWGVGKGKSTVKWQFQDLGKDKTFVKITNYNFQSTGEELISQIRDSTGGFTFLLAGLKAWLEFNIQLNLVSDKFPEELRK